MPALPAAPPRAGPCRRRSRRGSGSPRTTRRNRPRSHPAAVRTAARGAALLGEELPGGAGAARLGRDEDRRRAGGRGPVVREAEGLGQGRRVLSGRVLEVEPVAVDQPAVTQWKDLYRRAVALG